jgi:PAS domain S-box-containing protein
MEGAVMERGDPECVSTAYVAGHADRRFGGDLPPINVMAERVEAFDWAGTPLGAMAGWAQSLRTAVDICLHSRFPMFVWWGPHCTNIYNDAYAPLLGERHPSALGRSAPEVWGDVWAELGPEVDAVFHRGEATWNQRRLLQLYRNGYAEEAYFTWSYSPIRGESSEVDGLFCVVTEETERVLGEAQVADVLRSITDGFFSVDADWRFALVNPRAEQIIGIPAGNLLGRTLWEVYPTLDASPFGPVYRAVARDRVAASVTALFEPHDRWYEVRVYPSPKGGVLAYFTDVTDRTRAELDRERLHDAERAARLAAEQAGRIKDEFLATLGHELRTPLTAILGWASLIQCGEVTAADVAEGIEVIERNGRAQARIIDDLLDISRIVSGKVHLDMTLLDVPRAALAAVTGAGPAARAKGVRILSSIDPLEGVEVAGDGNRFEQVLWNLLGNAVKFTPMGGVVQLTVEHVEPNVRITVSDSGEGIEASFLPFVFDRFRQADGSRSRRHGGLGVGLALVKELVELHGGTVTAYSPGLGLGAKFVVDLPVRAVPPEAEPAVDRPPHATAVPSAFGAVPAGVEVSGVRVLVVDDDRDARAMIGRVLGNHRVSVTTTGSQDEAAQLVATGQFDVFVCDIGMPGEDGHALIRRIRASGRAKFGDIPAIALTAYARVGDRVRAIAAGFDWHLAKPVRAVELLAIVGAAGGRAWG